MKIPTPTTLRARTAETQELVEMLRQAFLHVANAVNNPDFGSTAQRPVTGLVTGQTFYDLTLAKPVWWNAVTGTWKDATGANV